MPAACASCIGTRRPSGPTCCTARARITAVDAQGRNFVDDVGVGDLWYFPSGIPHSIQGLGPDGCEFLLVFDDGDFDEDNTFLISDWFKHTPNEVLAKNFGVAGLAVRPHARPERALHLPGPGAGAAQLRQDRGRNRRAAELQPSDDGAGADQDEERNGADHRFQRISRSRPRSPRRWSRSNPGGMRELHWHPNTDEWQYYIEGQARMGVFGGSGQARTFDFQAGDVGYVPFAMGHYVENTGTTPLRFLEMFKSSYFADVSLDQWMALTPPELVEAHLEARSAGDGRAAQGEGAGRAGLASTAHDKKTKCAVKVRTRPRNSGNSNQEATRTAQAFQKSSH